MSGVSVFVGTRVPLQTFFDYLEGEEGLAEFIKDFSYLENPAIKVLENLAKMMIFRVRQPAAFPLPSKRDRADAPYRPDLQH